jgi:DNA polymerase bacteriophage-type
MDLVESAIKAVDLAQEGLRNKTQDMTFGLVESATQRDELLKHILEAYGVDLPDMQAPTLERRIEDPDLSEGLRELLAVRLQATTSSTAKYKKVLNGVSSDGRLRGTLQWCGATRTGRDSGRLFQPQNLMRPTLSSEEINFAIEAFKANAAELFYD